MAHFRGTIKGQRGEASRLGGKKSGLSATLNVWDFGVTVHLTHNPDTGVDEASIYLGTGSNGRSMCKHIGTFCAADIPHNIFNGGSHANV
jgi:hypothetical protein